MLKDHSPYRLRAHRQTEHVQSGHRTGGLRRALLWLGGTIVVVLGLFYLCLGDLRFFMNHYLRLTFFSKHYLVLLQNNYELRPGGGFITGYGDLTTFMGFPTGLTFHNSYDIGTKSYVKPPYPHEDMLKNEWYQGYTFRDANWDPDFPKEAATLIDFYKQKFPDADVDGVIAVNFSLIEKLLDRFGSIVVGDKTLTKANLFSTLEFEVNNVDRHSEAALSGRKDVLSEAAGVVMSKLKWHFFDARDVIAEGLRDKDIVLWLNSGLEENVIENGWGNTLTVPPNSDFLAVNLANLGSKKADRYLQYEVHDDVNISREIPEVTVEVTLRYPGFTSAYADNYKGYLRVYIPKDATVKTNPVDSTVETADALQSLGSKIILPAGGKMTLAYTYTLPRTLLNTDEYKLRLIRQSGAEALYRVTVDAAADRLMQTSDFDARENRASFTGFLTSDKDFSLTVLPDATPPYPIEQQFDDLTHATVIWNEPLSSDSAENTGNYKITDLNQIDNTLDAVTVTSAKAEGAVVRLELSGVTNQPLERYQFQLTDMRDQAGNVQIPNPKLITVVQRFKGQAAKPSNLPAGITQEPSSVPPQGGTPPETGGGGGGTPTATPAPSSATTVSPN